MKVNLCILFIFLSILLSGKEQLLLSVFNGEKWGYVKTNGKQIIPFKYKDAYEIKGGMYRVKNDGKYGFLSSKGKQIIPCEYEKAKDFVFGCAVVKRYKKKGYSIINVNNEVVTKKTYSIINDFSGNKVYFAEKNTKGKIVASGYIDVT